MKLVLVGIVVVLSLELALADKNQYLTRNSHPSFYRGTDLSDKESEEAKQSFEKFEKLNDVLLEKLPDNADPEANFEVAKSMLGIGSSLLMDRTMAVKLFLSLKETSGKCDFESYKIMAKIYEMINTSSASMYVSRINEVLTQFRKKHADECRPKYRKMYDELKGQMDKDQLEKLDGAFSELRFEDFLSMRMWGVRHHDYTLASIPTIRFTQAKFLLAVDKIVHQVITQAMKLPNWGDLKAQPKKMLDEFVFAPCKAYHELFKGVLAPARFDAKIEAISQSSFPVIPEFFGDDYEFTDAIAYNRICGSLLDGQKKVRKLMLEIVPKNVESILEDLEKS